MHFNSFLIEHLFYCWTNLRSDSSEINFGYGIKRINLKFEEGKPYTNFQTSIKAFDLDNSLRVCVCVSFVEDLWSMDKNWHVIRPLNQANCRPKTGDSSTHISTYWSKANHHQQTLKSIHKIDKQSNQDIFQ